MKRYHKKVYFPITAEKDLQLFTNKLNSLSWQYSNHSLDNIKYRIIDIEKLLLYIRDLNLNYKDIFEYYIDTDILKACYRINYNKDIDIILVINENKKIVTIYLNSAEDNHYTLKENLYSRA